MTFSSASTYSHAFLVSSETEIIRSSNSLKPQEPQRLPLNGADGSTKINPGESVEVPAILHAETPGDHELCLLFVFREVNMMEFVRDAPVCSAILSYRQIRSHSIQPH